MSQSFNSAVAVIGIDIGKNSFHVVGLDGRGAIVLRQKWSRGQIEARLANMPPCLIGMEACVGAHHLSRKLKTLGHDVSSAPLSTAARTPPASIGHAVLPRQSPQHRGSRHHQSDSRFPVGTGRGGSPGLTVPARRVAAHLS
jgi:hypothetical protein